MYERYLISLREGGGPDVLNIAVNWGPEWYDAGFLRALDDYIAASPIDFSDWMEGSWSTVDYKDSIIGIPYRSDGYFMLYNKGMFREAGLDPEKFPNDWNEYVEYAKKMTDAEKGVFGSGLISGGEPLNLTARMLPFVFQNDGKILTEDKTKALINEKEAVEAVKWYTDLLVKHGVEPVSAIENTADQVVELFINERIAMIMGAQYNIPSIREAAPQIELGSSIMPANPNTGKRTIVMGGWNYTIPVNSSNPDLAWKFIEFMIDGDNMALLNDPIPARQAAMESKYLNPILEDPIYEAGMDQLQYGQLLYAPYITQIRNTIANEAQNVLIGAKDVQKAMDDAAADIDALLSE
jgi:ABC-type glycerol-3-phosphate transport system substrate-binding protein